MRHLLVCLAIATATFASAQDVQVDFDKNHDFTKYKTFSMGEGEIITPKDQRILADEDLKKWVHDAIVAELVGKGLTQLDSLGDLTASYIVGSIALMDVQNLGPMGVSPQSSEQTWSRDYRQGNLVVDLNNRSNFLVWSVNATTQYGSPPTEKNVQSIIARGFKKFTVQSKKSKKKRA